jgi:hypothetical protein
LAKKLFFNHRKCFSPDDSHIVGGMRPWKQFETAAKDCNAPPRKNTSGKVPVN